MDKQDQNNQAIYKKPPKSFFNKYKVGIIAFTIYLLFEMVSTGQIMALIVNIPIAFIIAVNAEIISSAIKQTKW